MRSTAFGYTPTRPTPLFVAPTTELTAVPWSSSGSLVVWRLRISVLGRLANSGCVMSRPESTTVTGRPGPGESSWSAPIATRHHSKGRSGSVSWSAAAASVCSGLLGFNRPARAGAAATKNTARAIRSLGATCSQSTQDY